MRTRIRLTVTALALAVGLAGAPAGAGAATLTVNTTADEFGAAGDCSLREALDQANLNFEGRGCVGVGPYGNDTIVLADPAGYTLSRPPDGASDEDNIEGDLDVAPVVAGNTVTVTASAPTFIDGGDLDRVIDVRPGAIATITGVTIRGGLAGSAAGIRVLAGGATLNLNDSTLTDNHANNSAAGALSSQGTTTLTNVTISGNTTITGGGGLWVAAGTTNLNSVTVSANTADVDGDDVGGGGGVDAFGGTVNLRDTIVAGNLDGSDPASQSADCAQTGDTIASLGNNLIGTTVGCFFVSAGGDRLNQAPLLGPLASNGGATQTHALLANSPAIDGGSAMCPLTDQRGIGRPQGTGCDIGAFERQPDAAPTPAPGTAKDSRKCKKRKRKGGKRAASAKRKKCKKRKKRKRRN